ncbi:MAG TPA: TolC family protein, partial [Bacillota bacterium]
NSLKLARLKLASAVEDERKAKQQLTYSVKEAYYRLWLAEKMQGVAKSSYDNMERHYQRINSLYKAGTASRFDLLQAQVKWDNQKPSVIKAENGVKLARLSLATIIGIEPNREFQVEYDPSRLQLPEKVELSAQVVAEEAYQQRPELHQMQQLVEVAKANEALAKAGYLPNVALSYNYSLQGGSDIFLKNASNTVTLGVSLSGVAFDGFATPARVKSASENLELTRINEVNIKNQIRLETEQALQSLEESLETIRANQANIDLAQESLKMTQARFAAGMATTMDITDAQLVLDQASNGYYQGVSSYLTALAKLDLVAGKDQAQ